MYSDSFGSAQSFKIFTDSFDVRYYQGNVPFWIVVAVVVVLVGTVVVIVVVVWLVVVDEFVVPLVEGPIGEPTCLESCFDVM